ncbi:Protein sidekick-like protein [Aphelenchoides fujianensis]|nr:Protein sidekick-like protein [Aphelenchoides fujianensis]
MLLLLLLPSALALDAEPTAPPQILPPGGGDVNPTRIWLDENQRLSLRCPLNTTGGLAPSSFKIQWSKDGERLDSERAQFLEIGSVSRADSGVYRCLVGNERGTAYSWSMNVTVLYIDGFKAEKLSVLTVTEAGNFVLRPPALLASPQLHLSWRWFYDENEITSNTDYYITLQGALVVGNPAVKAGNYSVQVRAANSPTFTHRFDVRTTGDSGPTTTEFRVLHPPLDLVHVEGRERPFSLQSADTADDQAAVFECVPAAHGKNPPSVRWRLNGDLLVAETHGIHIEQRGRRLVLMNVAQFFSEKTGGSLDRRSATVQCEAASGPQKSTASARLGQVPEDQPEAIPNSISSDILKIESVQANNYGVYQCEAANSAGSDIATVWVREPRAADREGLFGPQNDEFTLPGDLVILQKPADVVIKPGADVVFHCVTNDPFNSRVSWTFNDEPVARNPRVQTNRTSLTIHSVRPTDAGRYTCLATSADSEDEAEAGADLMIRGSRLIEYGPNNQSQLIGTIIRMPCKISDEVKAENPEVTPEWSKNP